MSFKLKGIKVEDLPDQASCSNYFQKHKKRPKCPFCGYTMRFIWEIFYEGNHQYWSCPKCFLILSNLEDFSKEHMRTKRIEMKKYFKEEIKKREKGIEFFKNRLKLWGKYMSDRKKRELLAEVLEE